MIFNSSQRISVLLPSVSLWILNQLLRFERRKNRSRYQTYLLLYAFICAIYDICKVILKKTWGGDK